ncbi:MAG: P-loop NTPase, partial [Caldilineaceae bacterium]|nr:P-loop NTPase [Caldilineaceae bacterium]
MDLLAYVEPLRRWWWLMVIAIVVTTGSSFFYLREVPPTYQASTTLMVGNAIESLNPNSNELALTQQLAGTYSNIAKRKTVQDKTKEALGMDWLPEYDARVVWGTQLLEIVVLDTVPERAQIVANELARQLILQSPTSLENQESRQFIQEQLDWLQTRIYETQNEIETARVELAESFSASRIAERQAYISSLEEKLSTLQANYVAYQANTQQGAINTIRVIEPAEIPIYPADPNKSLKIMLLAAVVGLVLAAGAAYLLDYLDNSLRGRRDVETALRLPVLGAVPRSPAEPVPNQPLKTLEDHPAVLEAYRELRTNLQFLALERPLRSLLITSPAPTEGKSRVASNLAASLARAGYKVILLDVDLLRPSQHRLFNLPNEVGIIDALRVDDAKIDDLLYTTDIPQLLVMPSGRANAYGAELLNSARMPR